MNVYNISIEQLVTMWVFGIALWLVDIVGILAYMPVFTPWFLLFLFLFIPAFLIFYTLRWRNRNKKV